MRYFKVLNLQRQANGPFVLTEQGYKLIKNTKKLDEIHELIGECDEAGNLIEDIAAQNFIKPKKGEKAKHVDEVHEDKVDQMFSDLNNEPPDIEPVIEMQDFSDKTIQTESNGTGEQQTGEEEKKTESGGNSIGNPADGPKSGKQYGKRGRKPGKKN